jgi:hypothetical protein
MPSVRLSLASYPYSEQPLGQAPVLITATPMPSVAELLARHLSARSHQYAGARGAQSLDLFRMGRCISAPLEPIALNRSAHDEQDTCRRQAEQEYVDSKAAVDQCGHEA